MTTPGATEPASAAPWDAVGPGWFLVLYDHTLEATDQPTPERPRDLLLVSPEGRRFLLHQWAAGEAVTVHDWSPDGARAVIGRWEPGVANDTYAEIDLRTGAETALDVEGRPVAVGYTRPHGTNLVVTLEDTVDGRTQYRLVRTDRRGRSLATLAEQVPARRGGWVYLPDGTGAVIGAPDGLVVVGNDGAVRRRLAVARANCAAVRWWEPGVVLAACTGGGDGVYSQLWQVPEDGRAPTALTPATPDPEVNDLGFSDAFAVGGATVLQWRGDCSAAGAMTRSADGAVTNLPVEGEQEDVVVDAVDGRLAVWGRSMCDGPGLWLGWVDMAGRRQQVLVERATTPDGPERGIRGVVGFGTATVGL